MKSTAPPRFWCGIVPSALALIAFTLPAAAQLGGVKSPGKSSPSHAFGSQALGGGCGGGDTSALLIPVDGTFNVAPFTNGSAPCYRNDDGSTAEIPLEFTFEFYEGTHNGVFINNNGNLSFGGGFSTYSSTGFPALSNPMIAPFWGDLDTRDMGGVVYYRSEPNRFVVTWDTSAYYGMVSPNQDDRSNTFQVILTDGSDPLIGLGNNVCFSYGDMQWTTGTASGGADGFGGFPATVGANKGDGTTYLQIGLFDQSGIVYDGPDGLNDGVDYLDSSSISFNTSSENTSPIVVDGPDGCISGVAGETVSVSYTVIGPEGDQMVDWSIVEDDLPAGGEFNYGESILPGTTTATFEWVTTAYDAGSYTFSIDFIDDGSPPLTTTVGGCFEISGTESSDILGESGQFNVYSTRQLTIENADIAGRIGAEKNFFISNASIASGDVPADVDSMASGRAIWAANGVLSNGNIVAELHLNHLESTFHIANGTQEPRVDDDAWDHEAMSAALFMNSATYGAMMPTGSVTEDGFGNLNLIGSGVNPEIFLVTDNQLEAASHISVTADPEANVLINVEGGRVSPSNFGFEVHGTTGNRVLINMFEAWEIDFSQTNLTASILAPDSGAYISNISVSGNIVARWIELSNMTALGDLLVGSIPSTNNFTYSLPMQELGDSLYHNLVVFPIDYGNEVALGLGSQGGEEFIHVTFKDSKSRRYRADKIAMITLANGFTPEHVTLGDTLGVPVHFLEDGPLGGDDLISLSREGVDTSRRGVHLLELLKNDLACTEGLDVTTLRVVRFPKQGVVRTIPGTGQVWYAWPDDKNWQQARFQYVVQDNNGVSTQRVNVLIVR